MDLQRGPGPEVQRLSPGTAQRLQARRAQPVPWLQPWDEACCWWGNACVLLPKASCPSPADTVSPLLHWRSRCSPLSPGPTSMLALVWAGVPKGKIGGYTGSQVFPHRGPVRALLPCLLAEDPSLATTNLTPWLWSLKMEPALTDRLAAPAFEAPPLFIVEGH